MTVSLDPLNEVRRAEMRRLLLFSTLGHVLVLGLFFALPNPSSAPALPGIISVDLVSAPPGAPAPKPKAAPKPKPQPVPPAPPKPKPPPKPVAKKVVLPTEAPAAIPKPKPAPAKPKEKEVEYDDLLDQLRAEAGEEEPPPEPVKTAAASPVEGGGGRTGVRVPPEVAAWLRDARIHVRNAWVLPPGFRLQPLEAYVAVELDAAGNVIGSPRIERSSGNPWYDESVTRAISKASPLPAPPQAGRWDFVFRPEDSY